MPDKTEVTECFECLNDKIEQLEENLNSLRSDISQTISILIERQMQEVFGVEYWSTYRQLIQEKGPILARLAIIEQKLQTIKPLHEYRNYFEELKTYFGIDITGLDKFIKDYIVFRQDMLFWREQITKKMNKRRWKFW